MKTLFLFAALLFLSAISLNAQDKIYRNNGKIIEAKVIETGASEIKYKEYKSNDDLIYVLETDKIKKIVFENGMEKKFEDNYKDPERYTGQSNQAIKINFFAPLYGYTELSYEKSTGVGKGYELSLGIIGAGKSQLLNYGSYGVGEVSRGQFGLFVSAGYKFGKMPDFIIFGKTRSSHLMQGAYLKPIVYLGNYKENTIITKANTASEVGKQNITFGALQLEFGRQWIFGDKLLLDIYWGLGYGIDNKKDSYQYYSNTYNSFDSYSAFNYANSRLGKTPGVSVTFGVKVGLLIK
ncbi:MAG: hypothetical protein KGL19_07075 [Bacteroidota bacterium]|nr:hypothetical protein [Bacteroidota bacterium]